MATVLIVDDDAGMRAMLRAALASRYHVVEASNGLEGLTMFRQHQPSLVITDLNMPEMNGLEMVASLRADTSRVKIIAHSCSLDQPEKRAAMLRLGANLCLSKPVKLTQLRESVAGLLAAEDMGDGNSQGHPQPF